MRNVNLADSDNEENKFSVDYWLSSEKRQFEN